jgi:hypothetical protein
MINCMGYVPEFYLEGDDASSMSSTSEFHDRILEFVEKNLSGEINEITLCHFITVDGTVMTAKLPKNAYRQSMEKSMEFYIENEDYEKCNRIKNLLKQI